MGKAGLLARKWINYGVFREVLILSGIIVLVMITLKMMRFTVYTDADLFSTPSFVRAGTHFAALSNWCTRERAHSLTHPHTRIHTQILRN